VFRLGDLLSDALRSLVGPRRAWQAGVLDAWPEVVGELHARHTRAAGIRGNALVVTTDLPALSYELRLRRDALVEALNRKVGGAAIQDIQVVIRPSGESDAADSTATSGG
jgi:predicted nucleic acid-binding Zn ribbon protein